MDDILDDQREESRRSLYSNLALYALGLTFMIAGIIVFKNSGKIRASDSLWQTSFVVVNILRGSFIIGVVATVLSYVKKEPKTWIKTIAVILNAIAVLFVAGAIIYLKFYLEA